MPNIDNFEPIFKRNIQYYINIELKDRNIVIDDQSLESMVDEIYESMVDSINDAISDFDDDASITKQNSDDGADLEFEIDPDFDSTKLLISDEEIYIEF